MVERVDARLKDEFGRRTPRVRGAAKAMAHLMFGVIVLTTMAVKSFREGKVMYFDEKTWKVSDKPTKA